MSKQKYAWNRYWGDRRSSYTLSDDGCLATPEESYGYTNNNVIATASMIDAPCLALLGEPGIGKTSEVQQLQALTKSRLATTADTTLYVDLRSVRTEERLNQKLFQHPIFQSWLTGTHTLHLFIDSLDECLLRLDTIASLLADDLPSLPIHRLSIRIACRSALWPHILEEAIAELWGNAQCKICELLPLSRQDVAMATEGYHIDPSIFLQEVRNAGASPFVSKPITLQFLLGVYTRNGRIPASRKALYTDGCRILCEESNGSRIAAGTTRTLNAEQRMVIAARIAAVTIFCGKSAVYTGPEIAQVDSEYATVRDLIGGFEVAQDSKVDVTDRYIREALDTGLFTSRGQHLMGWAHQTYAEFLAARWTANNDLHVNQIRSLIEHAGDASHKLIPQTHETAAWIAIDHKEILSAIAETECHVLLRGDVSALEPAIRARIVDQLLLLLHSDIIEVRDLPNDEHIGKLQHALIAEQLRPFIAYKEHSEACRRGAVQIAEACQIRALQAELVTLALDTSEPYRLRVRAAGAVAAVADSEHRIKLVPLTQSSAQDDPDDELRGYALWALWPECISVQDLLSHLSHPHRPNFTGAYGMFLSHGFARHLKPEHLPQCLAWHHVATVDFFEADPLGPVVKAILDASWHAADETAVLEAYVPVVLSRLEHHRTVTPASDPAQEDACQAARRRLLLAAIVERDETDESLLWRIAMADPRLVLQTDWQWILDKATTSQTNTTQRAYASLAVQTGFWNIPECFDVVTTAGQPGSALEAAFAFILQPVELESERAAKMKAAHDEQIQYWNRHSTVTTPLSPPPHERVETCLAQFENGRTDAWIALCHELQLAPDSTYYDRDFQSDLTVLPGWQQASQTTRLRIQRAANRYIISAELGGRDWIGTGTIPWTALAGYRALRLIFSTQPEAVQHIADHAWTKLAPIVVGYPIPEHDDAYPTYRAIISTGYSRVPDEIIACVHALILAENVKYGWALPIGSVEPCWDARLAYVVSTWIHDPILKPAAVGHLIGAILRHPIGDTSTTVQVAAYAANTISGYLAGTVELAHAVAVAHCFAEHTPDAAWHTIWPAIQQRNEFGRELLEGIAHGSFKGPQLFTRLTTTQLADLFIWLESTYPHETDVEHNEMGAHFVSSDESVRMLRDEILRFLNNRATQDALNSLLTISESVPNHPWLKYLIKDTRKGVLLKTWNPPSPHQVICLAKSRASRFVQSGGQLLEAVIESLAKLETTLHGETPARTFLWYPSGQPAPGSSRLYRPQDEEYLSDYIKRHLEADLRGNGVVVNREVQIRRKQGGSPGQDLDIHIEAIAVDADGQPSDILKVIIETKGSWNASLEHAMRDQLTARYLAGNDCQHGLYLVGWFPCQQWDPADTRRAASPQLTLDEARKHFAAQARNLSDAKRTLNAFVLDAALR